MSCKETELDTGIGVSSPFPFPRSSFPESRGSSHSDVGRNHMYMMTNKLMGMTLSPRKTITQIKKSFSMHQSSPLLQNEMLVNCKIYPVQSHQNNKNYSL